MSNHLKIDTIHNTLMAIFGVITGAMSSLDYIEQIGRIVLILISICSFVLLTAINWEKGMTQLKKWMKKNGQTDTGKN